MSLLRRTVAFAADLTEAELGSLDDATAEVTTVDGEQLQLEAAAANVVVKKIKKPKPRWVG